MKVNTVIYPTKQSEFEIQVELYCELKKICDVRGCVKSRCAYGSHRHNVWFDLVVFYPDGTAAFIIECKNTPQNLSLKMNKVGRQQWRYSLFGVPLIRCGSTKRIDDILNIVEAEMEQWMNAHSN